MSRLLLALIACLALPLEAQIVVIGSTVVEQTTTAGAHYQGGFTVRNLTAVPQRIHLYKRDYRFDATGVSDYGAPGSVDRSNAAWVTPSVTDAVIPPNAEIPVSYAVAVPARDSLSGTYWSALMVEGEPSVPPAGGNRTVSVGTVVRYAIQLATHLGATGTHTVALEHQAVAMDSAGVKTLALDVLNSGSRAYRPAVWVEVYDASGTLKSRREQQRGLLYPGTSVRQIFALGALAPGLYSAVVFVDAGTDDVVARRYAIRF